MKIAICHNEFGARGGTERLVIYLAKHFDADIFTWFVEPKRTYSELLGKLNIYTPGFPVLRAHILKHEMASSWFGNLDLREEYEYDLAIASGSLGVYACIKNHPNIWYCPSPTRAFYDLYEYYAARQGALEKLVTFFWKPWRVSKEQRVVRDYVERIAAYSETVAWRINKYYDRNSEVIYPPVDTAKFECKDYESFFLVVQRLGPAKRTSLIVRAFERMPDKKLLIVGEGSERKELERLTKDCKNVQFLGNVGEEELLDLYARCLATIYVPMDEDFGLIPVESMASGKPCIAADEGGLRETVVDGETGFLIKPTIGNLVQAVRDLTPEKAEGMKRECIKRAEKFDISVFYKKFDEAVKRAMEDQKSGH